MIDQIVRGGSWDYDRVDVHADCRSNAHPYHGRDDLGFRVIKRSHQSRPGLRGGSWHHDQVSARAVSRGYAPPDYRLSGLGFRVLKQKSTQ